jgi:hypothetical protein
VVKYGSPHPNLDESHQFRPAISLPRKKILTNALCNFVQHVKYCINKPSFWGYMLCGKNILARHLGSPLGVMHYMDVKLTMNANDCYCYECKLK